MNLSSPSKKEVFRSALLNIFMNSHVLCREVTARYISMGAVVRRQDTRIVFKLS